MDSRPVVGYHLNTLKLTLSLHKACPDGVERAYFHKLFHRGMDAYWLQQIKRKPVPSKKESQDEHARKLIEWTNQMQASIEEWERSQNVTTVAAAAAVAPPTPPTAPSLLYPSISEALLDSTWEHAVKRFNEDQENDVSHFLLPFTSATSSTLSSPLPSSSNNNSSSDEG